METIILNLIKYLDYNELINYDIFIYFVSIGNKKIIDFYIDNLKIR